MSCPLHRTSYCGLVAARDFASGAQRAVSALQAAPGWVALMKKKLLLRGPDLVAQAREEWQAAKPELSKNIRQRWDRVRGRPSSEASAPPPA